MAEAARKPYRSAPRRSRAFLLAAQRLGERIRALRAERQLTQQAAAERADLEIKHWQLVEAGRTNPTLATLLAIAKALRVEPSELLKH